MLGCTVIYYVCILFVCYAMHTVIAICDVNFESVLVLRVEWLNFAILLKNVKDMMMIMTIIGFRAIQ